MPIVILKTNAGINFGTEKGQVSLRGFCLLNEVSNEELSALKKNESFAKMLKDGYIEVSTKASSVDSNNIAQEVVKEQAKEQAKKTQNVSRKK